MVARAWEDTLGLDAIGLDEDFFALGGDGDLAAAMLRKVNHACGSSLGPTLPPRVATVRGLAHAVKEETRILLAQPYRVFETDGAAGAGGTPFFFLHGDIYGGGLYCLDLARALGPEIRLHAIAPCRPEDPSCPPRVGDMARVHLETLRAIHPRGPYLLGGFCLGAVVAFEMALQLAAEGEMVSRLILVAPRLWSRYWRLRRLSARAGRVLGVAPERERAFYAGLVDVIHPWSQRLDYHLAGLRGTSRAELPVPYKLRWVLSARAEALVALLSGRPRRVSVPDPPLPPLGPEQDAREQRRRDSWRVVQQANRDYVPGARFEGRLVVLWPELEIPRRPGDPVTSLRTMAREVEAHRIPGGHNEALSRHVTAAAKRMRACLLPDPG